jgi:hypothetical protein
MICFILASAADAARIRLGLKMVKAFAPIQYG